MNLARLCVLALIASVLLTGCTGKRQEARALVQDGYNVSKDLGGYYGGLVSDADAFIEIIKFDAALRGVDPDAKLLDQTRALRKAAKNRVKAAEDLNDLYEALGQLMNYDASAAVQNAAANLQASLGSVGDSPVGIGTMTVDPMQVLEQVYDDIQIARQEKRVEHQAPVVQKTLRVVTNLFEKESPMYVELQRQYLTIRQDFGKSLLAKGEAIPDTILASQLKALGLRFDPGPVIDDKERAAVNAMIESATDKAIEGLAPTAKKLLGRLRAQESAQQKFAPNANRKR